MIPERLRPKECRDCCSFNPRINWCEEHSTHANGYDTSCKQGKI